MGRVLLRLGRHAEGAALLRARVGALLPAGTPLLRPGTPEAMVALPEVVEAALAADTGGDQALAVELLERLVAASIRGALDGLLLSILPMSAASEALLIAWADRLEDNDANLQVLEDTASQCTTSGQHAAARHLLERAVALDPAGLAYLARLDLLTYLMAEGSEDSLPEIERLLAEAEAGAAESGDMAALNEAAAARENLAVLREGGPAARYLRRELAGILKRR